jgi:ATP-dependent DNA helicase RecQ
MQDQVDALNDRPAFRAAGCAYVNSSQPMDEQMAILDQLRSGNLRLVYVAPERFRSQSFVEAIRSVKLERLVIDEAHCISEWGHDFRPDYLGLKSIAEMLGRPPITAVTATATQRVQESIIRNLGLNNPATFIGGFDRPNLHWSAYACKGESERVERLTRALPKLAGMGGSGLIYVMTRRAAEETAEIAQELLRPMRLKVGTYHAGLPQEVRALSQAQWLSGEVHLLVCTNAFGMGIDKPDVRYVVHLGYPESLEGYYQEAGRAGRDGNRSRCAILYTGKDKSTRIFFVENGTPRAVDIAALANRIAGRALRGVARVERKWLLEGFRNDETKMRLALAELQRAGVIETAWEMADEICFRVKSAQLTSDQIAAIGEDLDLRKQMRYQRLEQMMGYCQSGSCRRGLILGYFGDSAETDSQPGCCDNCGAPDRAVVVSRQSNIRPSPERMAVWQILEHMDSLRPHLTVSLLSTFLRAGSSKFLEDNGLLSHPLYGQFSGSRARDVDEFIAVLIERGYIYVERDGYTGLYELTFAGRTIVRLQVDLDISLPTPPQSNRTSRKSKHLMTLDEQGAFEALRIWRRAISKAEDKPAFVILHDSTLQALVEARPSTLAKLAEVSGIGPSKLEKYGEAILGVIRPHLSAPVYPEAVRETRDPFGYHVNGKSKPESSQSI